MGEQKVSSDFGKMSDQCEAATQEQMAVFNDFCKNLTPDGEGNVSNEDIQKLAQAFVADGKLTNDCVKSIDEYMDKCEKTADGKVSFKAFLKACGIEDCTAQ